MARLRFEPVAASQRPGALQVLSGAHQFGDLPDVPQIVKRPLMEHLAQGDLTGLPMQRHAAADFRRQVAQVFDVGFALLLEVVESIVRIGIPVQI